MWNSGKGFDVLVIQKRLMKTLEFLFFSCVILNVWGEFLQQFLLMSDGYCQYVGEYHEIFF